MQYLLVPSTKYRKFHFRQASNQFDGSNGGYDLNNLEQYIIDYPLEHFPHSV